MNENDYDGFVERVHQLLEGENAPLVRRASPKRFGWRLWLISPKDGRLASSFTYTPCDTATVTATCDHGNTVPSDDCVCGVHYVPNVVHFARSVETILEANGIRWSRADTSDEIPVGMPRSHIALTFGAAVGRIALDNKPLEKWGERPMRSSVYRILHICVPRDFAHHRVLEHRYKVPVTFGTDPRSALRAELMFNKRALQLEAAITAGGTL